MMVLYHTVNDVLSMLCRLVNIRLKHITGINTLTSTPTALSAFNVMMEVLAWLLMVYRLTYELTLNAKYVWNVVRTITMYHIL